MTGTPCGAEYERTPGEYLYCQRGTGHGGKHRLRVTVAEWSDPVCGAECGISAHMHRCLLTPEHEQVMHVCNDCGFGWSDPEPVPQACEDCGAPATHEHPSSLRQMPKCAEHAGSLCCQPLTPKPDPEPVPPGCPACDGVAGTACRCHRQPHMQEENMKRRGLAIRVLQRHVKSIYSNQAILSARIEALEGAANLAVGCSHEWGVPSNPSYSRRCRLCDATHPDDYQRPIDLLFRVPTSKPEPVTEVVAGVRVVPPWTCDDCGRPIYGNHACSNAKVPVSDAEPPCPPDRPACEPPCEDCADASAPEWCDCGERDLDRLRDSQVGDVRHSREWCGKVTDPEPVPQWRQMVGQAAGLMDAWMLPTPLGTALDILSYLEMYPRPIDDIIRLSRLVALCEAQVGDGWQADPDEPRAHPHESQRQCDLECLLRAVGWRYEARWKPLGTRAATMLRDLTEADA